jgi:Holliday junction resolvasome RuvABC endonuclease subunit
MKRPVSDMTHDEVDAVWLAFYGSEDTGAERVLGIDLGATFAFALVDGEEVVTSGWYNTTRRHEGGGMRNLRFRRAVEEIVTNLAPAVVCFEEPRGAFRAGADKIIQRQIGVLTALLEECEQPYTSCHQGTLKKFATGQGNASKELMRSTLAALLTNPFAPDDG